MLDRDAIHYPERAKQLISFKGMKFDSDITPSDIDGCIEFRDRLFVFFEIKSVSAPMPNGQRKMYERIVDAISNSAQPKMALFIIAEHNTKGDENIIAGECNIRGIYEDGIWCEYTDNKTHTLYDLIMRRYCDVFNVRKYNPSSPSWEDAGS